MSVDQFLELMVEDPELRQRLVDAGSNDERTKMVAEHGIEIPTQAQVTARVAELQEMADIDGGGSGWWVLALPEIMVGVGAAAL